MFMPCLFYSKLSDCIAIHCNIKMQNWLIFIYWLFLERQVIFNYVD